jgi:hypothetical protein
MKRNVLQWLFVGALLVGAQGAHAQMLGLSEGEGPGRPQPPGTRATFVCLASDGRIGTVYGTDVYTAESAVCAAAVHAGALPPFQAGVVTIVFGSGAKSFTGSARNGVTTRSYGPWDYTYTFARDGQPGTISWRTVWNKVPEDFTDPVTVLCPPRGRLDAPLWGTDVYTRDSGICAAAVHSGAITAESGGVAVVRRASGLREYRGTERFGVASLAYGPYGDAFSVTAARVTGSRATVSDAVRSAAPAASQPASASPAVLHGAAGGGRLATIPVPSADLEIAGFGPAVASNYVFWFIRGPAQYNLRVVNSGPDAADGATITVPASTTLTKTRMSCGAAHGAQATNPTVAEIESGWVIPTFPSGGEVGCFIVATVTGTPSTGATMTISVTAPSAVRDPDPGNNTATSTVPVRF